MKKTLFLMLLGLMACLTKANAEVDPNFHIFICFGQSNMEGNAQWESQDVGNVDERFQMLATCNFSSPRRTLGNWYKATCPIVSPVGKLGPSDYFGRTMVANLPADYRIGVIAVAMGGSPIEMFDKDKYQQKLNDNPNEWWAQIAKNYYGGNPYGRIIDMAKKAQQVGVIKGVLLHQGCSNCGDPNWPNMVNKIYNDMLTDLGLTAVDVPLFAGEVEYQDMGGGCSSHNVQVDRLPQVIPTAHVVSAMNLPGNGTDPWHFSAYGYRIFGMRYAQKVLRVAYDIDPDFVDPLIPTTEKGVDQRFTTLSSAAGTPFAIVNEADAKAFYCTYGRHLSYADFKTAFRETNSCYFFKLQKTSGGFRLRLITPEGNNYTVDGADAYLNSQDVNGDCCFVGGLNGQNGEAISKGAVWSMEYVEGMGFSIKNVGTGKYLKDATSPAKYDEPTYFTFCTLGEATTGVNAPVASCLSPQFADIYNLQGVKIATVDQWAELPRGLYIVNGKKVVKK